MALILDANALSSLDEGDLALDRIVTWETELGIADFETAREYSEIRIGLKRIGKPIPENDIWIAAIARQA